jgi:hypothetical protein
MRRIAILAVLIAVDMWLIVGSRQTGEARIAASLKATVSAQNGGCCPPGTGDAPYWALINGQCVQVYACGFNECTPGGCDPILEWQCINEGGIWDPNTCTCGFSHCDPNARNVCIGEGGSWNDVLCTCTYPCNPVERQQCISSGGSWDEANCTCAYPCDPVARQQCLASGCSWNDITCTCTCPQCSPGPPVIVGSEFNSTYWCVDCGLAEECTTQTDYYVRYCQDGRIYDSWSVSCDLGCQYVADSDCLNACLIY